MTVFDLVRAHYGNSGGFFSLLRPSGDGLLSKAAGVLFSLYALVLLFFSFHSLFSISVFPESLFLLLYLLAAALAVFFTSAPFAYGLFHMGRELSMLKSLPIRENTLFASGLIVLMADSFFPSAAAFLPLLMNAGWHAGLALFLLFWLSTSLLSSLFAISSGKKLFIGVVSADAVLLSFLFLHLALSEHEGPGVDAVVGIVPATLSCALLSSVLLSFCRKAFCSMEPDVGAVGRAAYRMRGGGMLKTLIMRQLCSISSDGVMLLKVVVGMVLPFLLLLATAISMKGKIDGTVAVFALSLVCSHSPASSTSYSRDDAYSDLLAPLPIPFKTDMLSRILVHLLFLMPTCAAGALVVSGFCRPGALFAVSSVLYPLIHGLASALLALKTDSRRAERNEGREVRLKAKGAFPTFIPFLLSSFLMFFSLSISVALGLNGVLLLPSCLVIESFAASSILFCMTKGRSCRT